MAAAIEDIWQPILADGCLPEQWLLGLLPIDVVAVRRAWGLLLLFQAYRSKNRALATSEKLLLLPFVSVAASCSLLSPHFKFEQ